MRAARRLVQCVKCPAEPLPLCIESAHVYAPSHSFPCSFSPLITISIGVGRSASCWEVKCMIDCLLGFIAFTGLLERGQRASIVDMVGGKATIVILAL